MKKIIKMMMKWLYWFIHPFIHKKTKQTIEEALHSLEEFHPAPNGGQCFYSCIVNNRISNNPEYDLSVIIPCFNVEKYVTRCMDSLAAQKSDYKIQYILVNDGATDNTVSVIRNHSFFDRFVLINKTNGGLSSARNMAIESINSKYIMFLDSDDFIGPENAIDNMLNTAYQHDADIVEGTMIDYWENKQNFEIQYDKVEKLDNVHGFSCGKLYRSNLFSNLKYPEGYWFEDTMPYFLVHAYAKRKVSCPGFVYYYRQREESITHQASNNVKTVDTVWILLLLMLCHEELGLPNDSNYADIVYYQIMVNAGRTRWCPLNIRENIFVIVCDALQKYGIKHPSKKYEGLYRAISRRDWYAYRAFCFFIR